MIALALFAIVATALVFFSWGHVRGVALERGRHLPYSEPRSIVTEYPVCLLCKGSIAHANDCARDRAAKRDERFLEAIRQRDEALAAFALATGITKTINDRAAESPELRAKLDRACRPWDEARTAHRINLDDIDRAAEVGR